MTPCHLGIRESANRNNNLKMRKSVIHFFLFCLLSSAYAQSFDAQHLLRFGDSLFQEGDYLNAIHEYKRYLFLYPDANKRDLVQFSLAASYQNAGKLDLAITVYQTLVDTYPQSPLIERSKSNIAQCQLLQGEDARAIGVLEQFLADHPDSALASRAQFTIGLIQMDNRDWRGASEEWEQVRAKYPQSSFAELSERLAHTVRRGESLPHRSSAIAGLLSAVIPGLGQTYGGKFSDGLYALIIVGVTGGGTAYYIGEQQYEFAIPLGVLGLFFYAGNVFGGFQSAKAFNLQHEAGFLDEMKAQIRESNLFGAVPTQSTNISFTFWRQHF